MSTQGLLRPCSSPPVVGAKTTAATTKKMQAAEQRKNPNKKQKTGQAGTGSVISVKATGKETEGRVGGTSPVSACFLHCVQREKHCFSYCFALCLVRGPDNLAVSLNGGAESKYCFRPVSNRGPFACEANVITTTLRKPTRKHSRLVPAYIHLLSEGP